MLHNGERKTIIEWAEDKNVCPQTLYQRKKRGWDDKEILTKPFQQTERMFTMFGLTFGLKDWAKILNISYHTLNTRIQRGWNVGKTFVKPVRILRRIYALENSFYSTKRNFK